jgi:hypothetical protein
MRRLKDSGLNCEWKWLWVRACGKISTRAVILLSGIAALAVYGAAQCTDCSSSPAASVLGVHSDGGRGCSACHTAHNGSLEAGVPEAVTIPLWGSTATPPYGESVLLGDPDDFVQVSPARVASASEEVIGVLLCLSCHDGNLTPQTMMPSQSYSRRMGLLAMSGSQPIPSFLGDPAFEHPLGPDATITLSNGLVFNNGTFSVTPGSPYARFVENYGLPVLTTGKRTVPFGINQTGQPYLLCTTCHNQHVAALYESSAASPIAGDGGGRTYGTYFFANGPYNPVFDSVPGNRAPSTSQFCRQCHLDVANEGNNALTIRTSF